MWVFSTIGFFSATALTEKDVSHADVPLPKDATTRPYVMVRARVRLDLVNLVKVYREKFEGVAPTILDLKGHDYPYRIVIPREDWAVLMLTLSERIDYSNFKSEVTRKQGGARHDLYMRVWSALYDAEAWLRNRVKQIDNLKKAPAQKDFDFWASAHDFASTGTHFKSDPRSASDMRDLYEDESRAIMMDPPRRRGRLPEGTHQVINPEDDYLSSPFGYEEYPSQEALKALVEPSKPQPRRFNQKPARRRGN